MLHHSTQQTEYDWSKYIFTEGRKAVGLTTDLLVDWVDYNSYFAAQPLGLVAPMTSITIPLPYMKNWLDIDSIQNANQEGDNTNYVKIHAVDDLADDFVLE